MARTPPPATLALALVTLAVFVAEVVIGGDVAARALGLIPANLAELAQGGRVGEGQTVPPWLTPVTYMFLHASPLHLASILGGLFVLGVQAEPVMGSKQFAVTYVLSGVVTAITIAAIIPLWSRPIVGASGAICGVLGAFLGLRVSEMPNGGRQQFVVILLEASSLLAVAFWLLADRVPVAPDLASSAAWHVAPFLLAWYCVRAWQTIAGLVAAVRSRRSVESRQSSVGGRQSTVGRTETRSFGGGQAKRQSSTEARGPTTDD